MGWIKYSEENGAGWFDPATITLAPTVMQEYDTTSSLTREDVASYIFEALRNLANNGKKMRSSGCISNEAVQIVVEEILNYIDSGEYSPSDFFERGCKGTIPFLAPSQEKYYKAALIEAQSVISAKALTSQA